MPVLSASAKLDAGFSPTSFSLYHNHHQSNSKKKRWALIYTDKKTYLASGSLRLKALSSGSQCSPTDGAVVLTIFSSPALVV